MISVIVPVYNVEKYLHRCVDSILNQTFTDFELILVDDGSPDQCGMICDEYAKQDSRIHVIHKENGGLSSARNAGIIAAKGEYLLFADSDDVIHPETLTLLWKYSEKNQSEIVIGNFCRFRNDSELQFALNNIDGKHELITGIQTIHRLYEERYDARYVSTCGKLIKRTLFEGIKFPLRRVFEDEFVTYLLYYRSNAVTILEQSLYYYFMNETGITGSLTLDKWFDEYDAQWERIIFYKEKNLQDVYHKALLVFLSSAKWDLVSCRKKTEAFDEVRGERFEQQYKNVLKMAHKENLLDFLEHYDYYILGNPKVTWYYRLKRIIMRIVKK